MNLWHRHQPCDALATLNVVNDESLSMNSLETSNYLYDAVKLVVDAGHTFIMKVPNEVAIDQSAYNLIFPDLNVVNPYQQYKYRIPASSEWTISTIIDVSSDHSNTPFSLASRVQFETGNFREMVHGHNCFEFRKKEDSNNGYTPHNFRLCLDGSVVNHEMACAGARGGTLLCPANAPIKCRKQKMTMAELNAAALRLSIREINRSQKPSSLLQYGFKTWSFQQSTMPPLS